MIPQGYRLGKPQGRWHGARGIVVFERWMIGEENLHEVFLSCCFRNIQRLGTWLFWCAIHSPVDFPDIFWVTVEVWRIRVEVVK